MDDPTPVPAEKLKGRTLEWLVRNPLVGLVCIVATIISVPMAVYFFSASQRSRELSYQVNLTKTTIVKSGQSSDLHVLYKGQVVSTDVTALEVVIWNAGKESIHSADILAPIRLTTSPKVPILECRIKPGSRSVSQVGLDTSQISEGSVGVTWKILEHDDGAAVQLIVAGPTSVTVKADGVVEGQAGVKAVDAFVASKGGPLSKIMNWIFIFVIVFYNVFVIQPADYLRHGWRKSWLRLLGVPVIFCVLYFVNRYVTNSPVPPVFR